MRRREGSRKKFRTFFERQFLPFCEARKFTHVDRLMPIDLTEFVPPGITEM